MSERLCVFDGLEKLGSDGTPTCSSIDTPADFYCYGCGAIVCNNHDIARARVGHRHSPGAHLDTLAFVNEMLEMNE